MKKLLEIHIYTKTNYLISVTNKLFKNYSIHVYIIIPGPAVIKLFESENELKYNKKMQHSCGVTYSIALSYQFQITTILVNLFQLH